MLMLFRYSAMRFKGKTILAGSLGLLSTCVILETIIFQISGAYLGKLIETYVSFMVSLAGMTMGGMFVAIRRDPLTDHRIGLVSGIAIAFGTFYWLVSFSNWDLCLSQTIICFGLGGMLACALRQWFFEPPAHPRLP
ncbi:hypothetical protein FHW17_004037 [Phyllobacterium sp. P30BS-XVII]|nr:hypothetical protein [Phyllobacterium sp. P30BS-XVII]